MKNQKALKILTLALTIAVLAIGFCFAASAAESELSVSIVAKNVSYSDYVKVLFAVDDTNAGGNDIELLYYLEDPIANPSAEAKVGVAYSEGYTDDNDNNYPAFYSAGFPAKHIGDKVYARAHIVGTDVYSDVVRYSVVEYLLERLYLDYPAGTVTTDEKQLYEYLLGYGEYAQKVLINGDDDDTNDIPEGEFITDYVLVGIEDGTLDGKYDQGIYFVGDTVYPQADGIATWNATVYDLSTGVGTTTEVNGEAAYSVTGFTMFTAKTEGETPTPAYKPDLTDTEGRDTYDNGDTPAYFTWDNWLTGGGLGTLEIVDGAPYGVASKVQHFNTPQGTKPELNFKFSVKSGATTTIIENDFMFTTEGSMAPCFMIYNSSGDIFTFYISANNGEVVLLDKNKESIGKLANDGEWFRLRIEIVNAGDGTSNVLFYLNDNRIAEDYTFTASAEAGTINKFRFWTEEAHTGDIYFDNTKFSSTYSPDLTDTEGRVTFSEYESYSEYKSAGMTDSWTQSGSTLSIVDGVPYGVDSKVLGLDVDNTDGTDPDQVYLITKAQSCNMFVFETDLMFAPDQNSTYEFTLRSGSQAHLVSISAGVSGIVTIQNGTTAVATVNTEEWFRLRVEYELLSSGSIEVRIYVNDAIVSTSTPNKGNVAPSELYRVIAQANSTADGYAYFDNVKFEQK